MSTLTTAVPVEERFPSVRQLTELGKEKGYLLYDEIYDLLPDEVVSLPDELDAGGATEADDLFDKLRDAAVDEDDEDTEELDVNQYGEMRTPLDNADQEEYGLLATLLQDLPGADQQSAEALFSGVQPAHQEQVAHIQQLAQAKAAEKQARAVKAAGGFNFEGCTVPTSFQFSP